MVSILLCNLNPFISMISKKSFSFGINIALSKYKIHCDHGKMLECARKS